MGRAADAQPDPEPGNTDPDQAWKVLSLVNDWIKHAETKTGACLAAAGVTGVLLFNLVKDQHDPGGLLKSATLICGIAVLLAGLSAAIALAPRLRLKRAQPKPANLLFFGDIVEHSKNDDAESEYAKALRDLTKNPEDLTHQIARQVYANAVVADRKFYWADAAVWALLIALLALAGVATIIGSA